MVAYKPLVIDITEKQLKDAIDGKVIRISGDQLGRGNKVLMLHPMNAKKVEKAALKKAKSVMLDMTDGELAATYEHMVKSGGSFFRNVWGGLKRVWQVLKDSGAASQLLDMAVAPAAAFTGQPALVGAVRQGVKTLTGAGRMNKNQRTAALRAAGLYLSN
jgi:hypothetical protein